MLKYCARAYKSDPETRELARNHNIEDTDPIPGLVYLLVLRAHFGLEDVHHTLQCLSKWDAFSSGKCPACSLVPARWFKIRCLRRSACKLEVVNALPFLCLPWKLISRFVNTQSGVGGSLTIKDSVSNPLHLRMQNVYGL